MSFSNTEEFQPLKLKEKARLRWREGYAYKQETAEEKLEVQDELSEH